jgi:hypothetical protein
MWAATAAKMGYRWKIGVWLSNTRVSMFWCKNKIRLSMSFGMGQI